MKIEEAIKLTEDFVSSLENDDVYIFINNVCNSDIKAIKCLIQSYKEQEEKAKWFKRLCNKNAEIAQQLQSELEKKDKTIDLMASDLIYMR